MKAGALALILALAAAPLAAGAETLRLLAFGDSLTEGSGLGPVQGLVPQLAAWLRQRGHAVEVVNAGRAGNTTDDGARRIGAELNRYDPDAVIVELGGNDLLGGGPPERAERNLDFILARAGDRPLLLVGIANPDMDPAARAAWAAIWPRLAKRHDALLFADLYAPLARRPAQERSRLLQADGIHASAEGIARIVPELGPLVEALIDRAEARN